MSLIVADRSALIVTDCWLLLIVADWHVVGRDEVLRQLLEEDRQTDSYIVSRARAAFQILKRDIRCEQQRCAFRLALTVLAPEQCDERE